MPHILKSELERRYGTLMQDIADYRRSRGYDTLSAHPRKMLWEVTRVLGALPDDPAAISWLQSAGPDETVPVILGYQHLCSALTLSQPEADAICLARLAVSAPTFRLACCRFAEWWFNTAHRPHSQGAPNKPSMMIPPPYPAQSGPQAGPT